MQDSNSSEIIDSRDPSSSWIEERRKICDTCEHQTMTLGVKVCGMCGCPIWSKTLVPFTACPIMKWTPHGK